MCRLEKNKRKKEGRKNTKREQKEEIKVNINEKKESERALRAQAES